MKQTTLVADPSFSEVELTMLSVLGNTERATKSSIKTAGLNLARMLN